ncbi:metallophosphoesterase family protein [Terribacillus saccharophilus]|uniref:metallophosphoesterase family protein n=1 Tax=Terribacillus saccharophilus TaxID=361277 RepID=UPI000BA7DE1A|nr:metallophosphoesterase [Terribacillus saccharophilus]PAF19839.1 YfcE family phosphodiesterase [Terribacillus saccharophilus]PAF21741.1 YfcE family phosphodiesterase [Terribacillus saccharophilus]
MKILITSDSHGLTNEVNMLKQRHEDEVAAYIHCGDSELPFDAPEMEGYYRVAGNCDYDGAYPEVEELTASELPILITHGHLYGVKSSLRPLEKVAAERDAKIVCYGHSHVARADVIDGRLYINPGSIRLPKQSPYPTYCILSYEDRIATVRYYTLGGEEVPELEKSVTFK